MSNKNSYEIIDDDMLLTDDSTEARKPPPVTTKKRSNSKQQLQTNINSNSAQISSYKSNEVNIFFFKNLYFEISCSYLLILSIFIN